MPEQAPTLRDMIRETVDTGLTYEQLSKRAVDDVTGRRASPALLNNIVNQRVDRMPYDYHLRAIAAGLGVPYERVRQAAIRQWLPAEQDAHTGEQDRAQLIEEAQELHARHLEAAAHAAEILARLEGRDTEAGAAS